MNPSLEEASKMAGARPQDAAPRPLPVLRPGLLAPLILAADHARQFETPW
jgi:hypothetical protein